MKFKRTLGLVLAVLMVMSAFSIFSVATEQDLSNDQTNDITGNDAPEPVIPQIPEMSAESITGDFSNNNEKNDLKWKFDPETGLLVIFGTDTVLEMDYAVNWDGVAKKDGQVIASLPWYGDKKVIDHKNIKEVIIAAPIQKVGQYMLAFLEYAEKITIPTTLTDLSAAGSFGFSNDNSMLNTVVVAGNEEQKGVIDFSYIKKISYDSLDKSFNGQSVKILTGDIEFFEVNQFLQKCTSVEILLKRGTPLDVWATKYKNGEFVEKPKICQSITFTYYGEDANIVKGDIVDGYENSSNTFVQTANNKWAFDMETGVLTITSNRTGWNETGSPNSVHVTGGWGAYKEDIEEVVFVGNISKISDKAFSGLTNLEKVTMTAISQIGTAAFSGCTNLKTVTVSGHIEIPGILDFSTIEGGRNGSSSFAQNAAKFFGTENKATGIILGDVYSDTIPLKIENLPKNVKKIYGSTAYLEAFCEANEGFEFVSFGKTGNKFVAWTIENGVMTILGEGAINDLGDAIAAYAENVKEVVIPATITEIGDGTFAGLTNLEKATFKGDAPTVAEGDKPFGDRDDSFKVVASESADGFEGDTWNGYALEFISYVVGDTDDGGDVAIQDAVLLAQYLAGWPVELNTLAADCNGDGDVTIQDAVLLAQYLAGWPVELVGP